MRMRRRHTRSAGCWGWQPLKRRTRAAAAPSRCGTFERVAAVLGRPRTAPAKPKHHTMPGPRTVDRKLNRTKASVKSEVFTPSAASGSVPSWPHIAVSTRPSSGSAASASTAGSASAPMAWSKGDDRDARTCAPQPSWSGLSACCTGEGAWRWAAAGRPPLRAWRASPADGGRDAVRSLLALLAAPSPSALLHPDVRPPTPTPNYVRNRGWRGGRGRGGRKGGLRMRIARHSQSRTPPSALPLVVPTCPSPTPPPACYSLRSC